MYCFFFFCMRRTKHVYKAETTLDPPSCVYVSCLSRPTRKRVDDERPPLRETTRVTPSKVGPDGFHAYRIGGEKRENKSKRMRGDTPCRDGQQFSRPEFGFGPHPSYAPVATVSFRRPNDKKKKKKRPFKSHTLLFR